MCIYIYIYMRVGEVARRAAAPRSASHDEKLRPRATTYDNISNINNHYYCYHYY